MSLSLSESSVDVFVPNLGNLSALLDHASAYAKAKNIDVTVIAEEPKIASHIPAMRKTIAAAISLGESSISIKATTNERLGAIGRGEGIAAMAIATVEQE